MYTLSIDLVENVCRMEWLKCDPGDPSLLYHLLVWGSRLIEILFVVEHCNELVLQRIMDTDILAFGQVAWFEVDVYWLRSLRVVATPELQFFVLLIIKAMPVSNETLNVYVKISVDRVEIRLICDETTKTELFSCANMSLERNRPPVKI